MSNKSGKIVVTLNQEQRKILEKNPQLKVYGNTNGEKMRNIFINFVTQNKLLEKGDENGKGQTKSR